MIKEAREMFPGVMFHYIDINAIDGEGIDRTMKRILAIEHNNAHNLHDSELVLKKSIQVKISTKEFLGKAKEEIQRPREELKAAEMRILEAWDKVQQTNARLPKELRRRYFKT